MNPDPSLFHTLEVGRGKEKRRVWAGGNRGAASTEEGGMLGRWTADVCAHNAHHGRGVVCLSPTPPTLNT